MPSAVTKLKDISSGISYEPLTPEDLPNLSRLIVSMKDQPESSLRVRNYTPAYYEWMYFKNPAGPAVVYGAKHNGQLVASFAITPKRFQVNGETVVCGKTMDMFTNPEYQGLGLMKEVTSRVFAAAKSQGITTWYVTPSPNSYPIFLKWGYVESFSVHYVVRILNYAEVLGATLRPSGMGRLVGTGFDAVAKLVSRGRAVDAAFEIREEQSFGPEADELWSRCAGYSVALVRDSGYLNWRYVENPDSYQIDKFYSAGELRGILITKLTLRRGITTGEFVDCVVSPEDVDVREAMYRTGLRRFLKAGCAFAQTWAIENSEWEQELKRSGVSWRRKRMPLLLSPGAARKEFYDGSCWYLTPGDGNDL